MRSENVLMSVPWMKIKFHCVGSHVPYFNRTSTEAMILIKSLNQCKPLFVCAILALDIPDPITAFTCATEEVIPAVCKTTTVGI